ASFSISSISAILSSVIVISVQRVQVRNSNLSRRPTMTTLARGSPLRVSGPPPPDSGRSLRRATYPQLLHHAGGHGPLLWTTWTIRDDGAKRRRQTEHQQIATDSGWRSQGI